MEKTSGYKLRGYVVIQDDDFMQCIGVYNTVEQAYGAAYLFLDSLYDIDEDAKVSLPIPMEGDTGFFIVSEYKDHPQNIVRILFNEEGEED